MSNMIDMLINSIVTKTIDSKNDKQEQSNLKNKTITIKKGVVMKLTDIENNIIEKYGEELKDKPVKEVVKIVTRAVFDEISEALAKKETISIYKFGRFYPYFVAGREGFNHATKKPYKSKDKYVPKFEPSDGLKEKVAPID